MNKLKNEPAKTDSEFHGSSYITQPGTNIFLDLGFPPKDAAELWENSKLRIAEKLAKQKLKNV
ncbi:hypothetical protein [Methylotenera sp.]|uniref:hypothetical protein n=1 Tax=Methylotenera sp. TaxID=2051956 RepID=UPI002720EFB8|nr:hypothetical protein [Methylotenera sp.]MDO9204132.1 hypothetical protein [Methylotenera sp.]MDP2071734.1 hypothetical protein [Methylotenera sp.]MDP3006060.1 hypothetical protein [Methylotenera sp.]